jgi:tetratricopeptide (TPR) repeat protein
VPALVDPFVEYCRIRLADDPHLGASTSLDELRRLGFGGSYQSLTAAMRRLGFRPSCHACHAARGRDVAVIEHPPGAETQFDLVELPYPPARLYAIAALMALTAGDRPRAANLLAHAGSGARNSLLVDVARQIVDAEEDGGDDAVEELLKSASAERLEGEPTCLLYLGERAARRGDLNTALTYFERAYTRHPRIVGGRLGVARVLIERMVRGDSTVPLHDQQEAVRLAIEVREDMRQWAGPSERAHLLVVQERILTQACDEVIALATPTAFGGDATDREAADPTIALLGAKASMALGDRARARRFGDAVAGTSVEPLIRAIAADPRLPRTATVELWRAAFGLADTAAAARACLYQLARHAALAVEDLDDAAVLANLDEEDRILFTARNVASGGDVDAVVELLGSQDSPAASEMLVEVLRGAHRHTEALASGGAEQ